MVSRRLGKVFPVVMAIAAFVLTVDVMMVALTR
jgi:hypothetical protein